MQQRLAGGCNLDRPVDWLVRGAGFTIEELSTGFLRGPKVSRPWAYLYEGVAKVDARPEPSGDAGTEADRFKL